MQARHQVRLSSRFLYCECLTQGSVESMTGIIICSNFQIRFRPFLTLNQLSGRDECWGIAAVATSLFIGGQNPPRELDARK